MYSAAQCGKPTRVPVPDLSHQIYEPDPGLAPMIEPYTTGIQRRLDLICRLKQNGKIRQTFILSFFNVLPISQRKSFAGFNSSQMSHSIDNISL